MAYIAESNTNLEALKKKQQAEQARAGTDKVLSNQRFYTGIGATASDNAQKIKNSTLSDDYKNTLLKSNANSKNIDWITQKANGLTHKSATTDTTDTTGNNYSDLVNALKNRAESQRQSSIDYLLEVLNSALATNASNYGDIRDQLYLNKSKAIDQEKARAINAGQEWSGTSNSAYQSLNNKYDKLIANNKQAWNTADSTARANYNSGKMSADETYNNSITKLLEYTNS